METLSHLLSPFSVEDFFVHYWQQQGLHIPNQTGEKFQHLFSWETLSYLLNFHEKNYPLFRLAQDKKVLGETDNEQFLQHCQEGATLIIDQVHKRVPKITELASAIRYELGIGHRTQINAYCSWPSQQGFDCHYDTHEVFILQIEGCKEWFVFPDTLKYPLADQPATEQLPPDSSTYIHTTLTPGDLLYVPRGHWHYAIAKDEPSIHLTLGVHCHKGINIFDWLKEQFKEEQQWRQNLPVGVNELDSNLLKSYLETLTQELIEYLNQPDLNQKYADYLASLEAPLASYDFPYQVGFGLEKINLETYFYRPPYQRVMIETNANPYRIRIGKKEIRLAGIPYHALEKLFYHHQFSGKDIQNWLADFDWHSEIYPLLCYLVKEQIIFIDHRFLTPFNRKVSPQEISQ